MNINSILRLFVVCALLFTTRVGADSALASASGLPDLLRNTLLNDSIDTPSVTLLCRELKLSAQDCLTSGSFDILLVAQASQLRDKLLSRHDSARDLLLADQLGAYIYFAGADALVMGRPMPEEEELIRDYAESPFPRETFDVFFAKKKIDMVTVTDGREYFNAIFIRSGKALLEIVIELSGPIERIVAADDIVDVSFLYIDHTNHQSALCTLLRLRKVYDGKLNNSSHAELKLLLKDMKLPAPNCVPRIEQGLYRDTLGSRISDIQLIMDYKSESSINRLFLRDSDGQ